MTTTKNTIKITASSKLTPKEIRTHIKAAMNYWTTKVVPDAKLDIKLR